MYLASAPKSNRAGAAYWAAAADVEAKGSLPVPRQLRSATWRERRDFGHGAGYRYPHDYEGADVEQQYLPDALVDRRYYRPTDQGMESQIAARLDRLRAARDEARSEGGPRRIRGAPDGEGKKVAPNVLRSREEARKRIAEREKREASG